jgi:hypothetical protein
MWQQELAEAGDEGQRRYEDETPPEARTSESLNHAINSAVELKKQKLSAPFKKCLSIVNPANGVDFLDEVRALCYIQFIYLEVICSHLTYVPAWNR